MAITLSAIILNMCIISSLVKTAWSCTSEEWQCTNGNCIPSSSVNNSVNDCIDNSDEGFSFTCPAGRFKCTSAVIVDGSTAGSCIPQSFYNDGTYDCDDQSDEVRIIGSACDPNGVSDSYCCSCENDIPESECNATVELCQCRSGRYSNETGTECIIRVMFDPCVTNPDCYDAITHTACIEDMCQCDVGYYPSEDNTTCIANKLYDPCELQAECTNVIDNSDCMGEQCLCNSGYHSSSDNSTCNRNKIGDDCIQQSDCTNVITHSRCEDEVCRCTNNYLPSDDNTRCMTRRVYDSCDTTSQCAFGVANSNCTNGQCYCNSGFYENSILTICSRRQVGSNCTLNTDCTDAFDNSMCSGENCTCINGYQVQEDNNRNCSRRYLGSSCMIDLDCNTIISNSYCLSETCQCINGAFDNEGNSADCEYRQFGDPCSSDLDCSASFSNSICNSILNTCQCDSRYYVSENGFSCILRTTGSPCSENTDCLVDIDNSECVDDVCSCIIGYYESSDRTSCVRREIGEECSSDSQCAALGSSICSPAGACACQDGAYIDFDGTCTPRVVGDSCLLANDCALILESARCIDETCQCAFDSCAAPTVGALPCNTSSYCSAWFGNATCTNGICSCSTGFTPTVEFTYCRNFELGDGNCRSNLDCNTSVAYSYCDANDVCRCTDGYQQSDSSCALIAASCSDFACKFPWLIALLVLIYIAGVGLLIFLIFSKKIFRCKDKDVSPADGEIKYKAPGWKKRLSEAKERFLVMYKDKNMLEPEDIDVFTLAYAGGAAPSMVSHPPLATESKLLSRPGTAMSRPGSSRIRPLSSYFRGNSAMSRSSSSNVITVQNANSVRKSSLESSDGFRTVEFKKTQKVSEVVPVETWSTQDVDIGYCTDASRYDYTDDFEDETAYETDVPDTLTIQPAAVIFNSNIDNSANTDKHESATIQKTPNKEVKEEKHKKKPPKPKKENSAKSRNKSAKRTSKSAKSSLVKKNSLQDLF